jgi:zinc protease
LTANLLAAGFGLLALVLAPVAGAVPQIQTWETPNGARVLFVPAPDLPMVDVRVVFDAGSARDAGRSGLASLTANMLDQGAGAWDADTLAERLESVGASLSTGALRDMAFVSVRSLTQTPALDTALETMAAVLAEPRFAPRTSSGCARTPWSPCARRSRTRPPSGRRRCIGGSSVSTPTPRTPPGPLESVAAMTRDDLAGFHDRFYVGRNAVVAIVGALDRAQAEASPSGSPPGSPPGGAPARAAGAGPRRPRSSSSTSPPPRPHLRRSAGDEPGDPDYFPLYVGNHILGGSGLVSLLMEEVREKRGLSYSVYSYFLPMSQRGPFLMGLSTKNDQAEAARTVLMDTVRRFREEGPTEELDRRDQEPHRGLSPAHREQRKIVEYLAMIGFYRLPLDYLDTFTDQVAAVSAEDIRDAFSRRVDPERFATVIVGPRASQVARAVREPAGAGESLAPADPPLNAHRALPGAAAGSSGSSPGATAGGSSRCRISRACGPPRTGSARPCSTGWPR